MQQTGSISEQAGPKAPLPAPRIRTVVLLAISLIASVVLTGWVGAKEELLVGARLNAPTTIVRAPIDARVAQWMAKEGAIIAESAPLARLLDHTLSDRIEQQRRVIADRTRQLARRKAKAEFDIAWRLRKLEGEILASRLKAAELLKRQYERRIELHAWNDRIRRGAAHVIGSSPDEVFRTVGHSDGLVLDGNTHSLWKLDSARNGVEVTRVQLQLCENRLSELLLLKRQLPGIIRRAAGIEEAIASLGTAQTALQELQSRERDVVLKSPAYGMVRFLNSDALRSVKSGEQLVRIVDHEHRFLTVQVPSEFLARFRLGQQVRVKFNDHVKHFGTIREIQAPTDDSSNVTIVVVPQGRLWPVIPLGSAAHVVVPEDD